MVLRDAGRATSGRSWSRSRMAPRSTSVEPHGDDHHRAQHRPVGQLPRAQRAPPRRHVDHRRRVRRRGVSASGEAVDEGPVGCDLIDEPIDVRRRARHRPTQLVTVGRRAPHPRGAPGRAHRCAATNTRRHRRRRRWTPTSSPRRSALEFDSAKDVAERVGARPCSVRSTSPWRANDATATTFVTMEGPSGDASWPMVVFDEAIGRDSVSSSMHQPHPRSARRVRARSRTASSSSTFRSAAP